MVPAFVAFVARRPCTSTMSYVACIYHPSYALSNSPNLQTTLPFIARHCLHRTNSRGVAASLSSVDRSSNGYPTIETRVPESTRYTTRRYLCDTHNPQARHPSARRLLCMPVLLHIVHDRLPPPIPVKHHVAYPSPISPPRAHTRQVRRTLTVVVDKLAEVVVVPQRAERRLRRAAVVRAQRAREVRRRLFAAVPRHAREEVVHDMVVRDCPPVPRVSISFLFCTPCAGH